MYGNLTTEYLCYLMNRAQLDAEGDDGYLKLCEILHNTPFLPIIDMDSNRCSDCCNLRVEFADSISVDDFESSVIVDLLDGSLGETGTMMEFTVIFAELMNFEMSDSEFEASTRKWFLEMMCNCGLDKYKNEEVLNDEQKASENIKEVLDKVIFRKTGWDGEGGFFPLDYPQYDQRKVEFLIQMNNYIEENYDIC